MPARDMFIAMTADPQAFVNRLISRVQADFKRLPYPITDKLFVVSHDGVSAWHPENDSFSTTDAATITLSPQQQIAEDEMLIRAAELRGADGKATADAARQRIARLRERSSH
jgi:hypothetical protein